MLPTEMLLQSLEQIIAFHQNLNTITKDKTDILVRGDIEALKTSMKLEANLVKNIRKVEAHIYSLSNKMVENKEHATLNDVIKKVDSETREQIEFLKGKLEKEIQSLVHQNDLNQQLLTQSLQFVDLSLDLLNPEIDSFNYDKGNKTAPTEKKGISIFDSKA